MNILSEEEVYNGTKNWLLKNGYLPIAGQPARGVDHLPVVEIKSGNGFRGSFESYKPDLLAIKDGFIYIIECKPKFDKGDCEKINDVLSSPDRIRNFYNELAQYKLLKNNDINYSLEDFSNHLIGVLAFSGNKGPETNLKKIIVKTWTGEAEMF